MKNIEVEIRSFLTKEKYEQLVQHFKKIDEGKVDEQETYYFSGEHDLRIQKKQFLC